ncbi:MAG: alpha-amylase family glycosyl hydrolase [Anaerolineales bacterium]
MKFPDPPFPTFPLTAVSLHTFNIEAGFDYAEIHNARQLSHIIRAFDSAPRSGHVSAGEIAAIGIMGKIYSHFLAQLDKETGTSFFLALDDFLIPLLGSKPLQKILNEIVTAYPLPSNAEGVERSGRSHLYKISILLFIVEANPAFSPYHQILVDEKLFSNPLYQVYIEKMKEFLSKHDPASIDNSETLLSFLEKPYKLHPSSLIDQLFYIKTHWQDFLDEDMRSSITRSLDYIREDHEARGLTKNTSPEPFTLHNPGDIFDIDDKPHFSQDSDWMSNVVLIAKNIYVWLDQLSNKYSRDVKRLDQIPEQELSNFANRGISGLWLIGVWERSSASRRIKRLCGNPEAIPSAYSIFDYKIARDLGGEKAFYSLKQIASKNGIHLAADMVPNHVGIYSKWVVDHPDWFLSLESKPYPHYSYTGPDLSESKYISIFLEDHYFDKSDAAVVFKRINHRTNHVRYIYHGNDGTSMPWNDTAQLNYLIKDVREAVINTILKVADKFSIIRFDAAMTLTKKHFQRLWFPEPGTGGAIPTRSEFGMTNEEFDVFFPREFWRQVVQRIADEKPETLLIAEAFWMMEGYFVRNLGMHRVYNSAFMHMLRDEKNAKFRNVIKKTLDYDPRILKRYVNFMNNPDEDTAISQFDKGGKYFGACVMMATLPGLPMFGHGQIEGLHEKYGMEYDRAYYDESPNQDLISRHEREIFPLLQKRRLFSGVKHFYFFDFVEEDNCINDDVYAYTNRYGEENALIIFHNKWGECKGAIKPSIDLGDDKQNLGSALGLEKGPQSFILFKDHISGLSFIRSTEEFFRYGLDVELGAYDYRVYLDFRQVTVTEDNAYTLVQKQLAGSGTHDFAGALQKARFRTSSELLDSMLSFAGQKLTADINVTGGDENTVITVFYEELIQHIPLPSSQQGAIPSPLTEKALSYLSAYKHLESSRASNIPVTTLVETAVILWIFLSPVLDILPYRQLKLRIAPLLQVISPKIHTAPPSDLTRAVSAALKFADRSHLLPPSPSETIDLLLKFEEIRGFINLNEYQGSLYYHQESFEDLLSLTTYIEKIKIYSDTELTEQKKARLIMELDKNDQILRKAHNRSQFQISKLKQEISRLE